MVYTFVNVNGSVKTNMHAVSNVFITSPARHEPFAGSNVGAGAQAAAGPAAAPADSRAAPRNALTVLVDASRGFGPARGVRLCASDDSYSRTR